MNARSKADETEILRRVEQAAPEIFGINFTNHEAPDFLSAVNPKIIGLEMTKYVREELSHPKTPAREAYVGKIRSKCTELLKARGMTGLAVSIFPTLVKTNNVRNFDEAAEEIATLVHQVVMTENLLEGQSTRLENPLIEGVAIRSISIFKLSNCDAVECLLAGSGWIPDLKSSEIQRIIDNKGKKLPDYRKNASYLWLLITLDEVGFASYAGISDDLKHHRFQSGFDRVFLFASRSVELVELCIDKG